MMKQLALVTAIAALLAPAWSAPETTAGSPPAAAVQKPVVILKVRRIQNEDKDEGRFTVGRHGRFKQKTTTTSQMTLEMEVRLMSRDLAKLQLEWYFIGETAGGKRWVCDQGEKTLELGIPIITAVERVTSEPLRSKSKVTAGGTDERGSKVDGYIVLVKWKDTVLKAAASPQDLEEIAYSPEKLKKLVRPKAANGN